MVTLKLHFVILYGAAGAELLTQFFAKIFEFVGIKEYTANNSNPFAFTTLVSYFMLWRL